MPWLAEHWKDLLLAVLAIDAALIPLFPEIGVFKKIKEILESITKK